MAGRSGFYFAGSYCTGMTVTSTTCNTYKIEKNRHYVKSDLSVRSAFFSFQGNQKKFDRKQAFCSIFGKAIAKHCHFSLTEVTVIRKNHSSLIGNKRARVVCEALVQSNSLNFLSFGHLRSVQV